MAINVIVVRKQCGDLTPNGFQNEAKMVEHFLTQLHFNDPKTQLEWLQLLHDKTIKRAIEDFKADYGL